MIRTLAVVSTLALVVAATPAAAQLPFRFGIQAGASMPTGDFADVNEGAAEMGYNVGLLAEFKPMLLPVGIRGDVIFNEFNVKDEDAVDYRILNVNGNAILEMPGVGLSPYLLGGAGWYRLDVNVDDSRTGGDVEGSDASGIGFNVGGGIRFGLAGFGAAVEAHYRTAKLDVGGVKRTFSYVPISFVLTF